MTPAEIAASREWWAEVASTGGDFKQCQEEANDLLDEIERLRGLVGAFHEPRFSADRHGAYRGTASSTETMRDADSRPPSPGDRVATSCSCGWKWNRWFTFAEREECGKAHAAHVAEILDGAK